MISDTPRTWPGLGGKEGNCLKNRKGCGKERHEERGDMNDDGVMEGNDIPLFVERLLRG